MRPIKRMKLTSTEHIGRSQLILSVIPTPGRAWRSASERRSAVKCPKCKLENPPTAQRCDCGYDFASKAMKASYCGSDSTGRAAALAR